MPVAGAVHRIKSQNAQEAIWSISKELLKEHSGQLRIWPYSKFGTGRCLAGLWASGALNSAAAGTLEIDQTTIGPLEAWLAEESHKSG